MTHDDATEPAPTKSCMLCQHYDSTECTLAYRYFVHAATDRPSWCPLTTAPAKPEGQVTVTAQ